MKRRRESGKYLFVLPTVLLLLGILFIPIAATIVLSVYSYPLLRPDLGITFVGLENFIRLSKDRQFINSLVNSLAFAFSAVAVELVFGTLIALTLNAKVWGKNFFKVALLIPMIMMPIVVGISWRILLLPQFTPLTQIFEFFHINFNTALFLTDAKWAMISIIIADVWQWTPFVALLVFASLQSIPGEIYEAARVDGASSWNQFRFLTLPLLKPSLIAVAILRGMDAFRTFDLVHILTRGGPGFSTELVSIFNYRLAFTRYEMGYASAVSVAVLIVLSCLVFAVLRLTKGEGITV